MEITTRMQEKDCRLIEKLEKMGILGSIRQRVGAENESDESFDYRIVNMGEKRLVAEWVGFEIGDENWAYSIISKYETLKDFISKNTG